jgi:probable HAF family extracellular repeat protein
MRTPTFALLLAPLLLLATACADQNVTAPQDALFSTDGSDVSYEIITIPTLGGRYSSAMALNEEGMVVGFSENAEGRSRAFSWTMEDGIHDLLGESNFVWPVARGISDDRIVVGDFRECLDEDTTQCHGRGFVHDMEAGGIERLPPLSGQHHTYAFAFNGGGLVVGVSWAVSEEENVAPDYHLVVWTAAMDGSYGAPVDLSCITGTFAMDMNSRGDVVANCQYPAGPPLVWIRGADGYAAPQTLGTSNWGPVFGSTATAIDDSGRVVGWVRADDANRGQLWHPANYAAPVDLGLLGNKGFGGGTLNAINNKNQIIGSHDNRNGDSPTIRTVNDAGDLIAIRELEKPKGYKGATAGALNDLGWVTGQATHRDGTHVAILWRVQQNDTGDDDDHCEPHPRFPDRCK